ncbi:uncharacterized protein AC631_04829 [Debaryomyces fabryi]|uniref:Uncharacterized protein n=1 Tax=Debaryomyces fabryi TaxID=58627 RepID=A0A0V1PTE8_9ASCO|nr:uncharacterized protein AC631_04829 [Debaryomyces fabryi]KRZ99417.1 hypothetical protein AC631_04829 [Debaryomyces fabryi]CUM46175.1 unnamed protein product [Debaryomyces fabryi]
MGVTGLLQHLKEIQDSTSLSKYRGKTLAVDTYGWLHRGLISCAQELCQDVPTKKYINSVMKKIDMLRHFGVEPYLVFDGAYLPTKAETAKERRLKRQEAQEKANQLIKDGNRKLAWKEFMKAAGVTPQMAKSIMVELDMRKVKYIVAPYEADPQMVYLERIGLVDGILSEDSDLLIFGCNRLITKLNDFGECIEICRDNFSKVKKIPYLSNYTQEQLRLVAMLSGCDYTKGIPGIGLKTAFNLVKKFNNLEKVLIALRSDGKKTPIDFEDEVYKANLAFQFQKVFNPLTEKLETLNSYPDDLKLDFEILEECCGKTLSETIHAQICTGKIHPNTLEILVSREQSLSNLKGGSINLGSQKSSIPSNMASRSKSATIVPERPKTGAIDSFFSTVKSTREMSIHTETPSKRMRLQAPKEKVSPTTRKIKRIANESDSVTFVSPKGKISKFFGNVDKTPVLNHLPTPISTKQAPWDSSIISGDSDIPDEFSSPVNHIRGSQCATNNITDGLTDNDFSDDEVKDLESQTPDSSSSLKNSNTSLEFGIDEEDDIIEESPIKSIPTNDKLRDFAKVLREKYLLNSSTNIDYNPQDKPSHLKNTKPLAPSDLNIRSVPLQSQGKERQYMNHYQENIRSQEEVKENILQINKKEACQVGTANIQVNIEKKQSISLQRFAFRG